MLDEMTNTELIENAFEDPDSSEMVVALAERLQQATYELDHLTTVIKKLEAPNGTDPRG